MKNLKTILGTAFLTAFMFTSCTTNDDVDVQFFDGPSPQAFKDLKDAALENNTQNFQFEANGSNINLTSDNGVQININTNCLTLNGDVVSGTVDLEYVELFEKGNMLSTNKPTMGILPNGDKALLISGGEFFMEATQNGVALETNCNIQLIIPSDLTGGTDPAMTLWEGQIDENDNLAWREEDAAAGQGGVFGEGGQYYAFFQSFGWSNVDRFYNDPRPKTTILVGVPDGFDNQNSNVYLSYDGEETGLANLDTYDAGTGLFSEHYGQVPVGLECHIIFATEDNGNWRYAIKAVTIAANDVFTFTLGETTIATEAELTTIINGLP
ncbi:hypothetical protein [Ascidiimonas sp. W6]|uniref:hypothetical protein n=1 Tax=Ascidiimonas meishanensis TaxID=3128903 RepID=UPI0030EF422F